MDRTDVTAAAAAADAFAVEDIKSSQIDHVTVGASPSLGDRLLHQQPPPPTIPYIGLAIGLGTCLCLLALSIGAVFLLNLRRGRGKRPLASAHWHADGAPRSSAAGSRPGAGGAAGSGGGMQNGKPSSSNQMKSGPQDFNVLPLMNSFQGII